MPMLVGRRSISQRLESYSSTFMSFTWCIATQSVQEASNVVSSKYGKSGCGQSSDSQKHAQTLQRIEWCLICWKRPWEAFMQPHPMLSKQEQYLSLVVATESLELIAMPKTIWEKLCGIIPIGSSNEWAMLRSKDSTTKFDGSRDWVFIFLRYIFHSLLPFVWFWIETIINHGNRLFQASILSNDRNLSDVIENC